MTLTEGRSPLKSAVSNLTAKAITSYWFKFHQKLRVGENLEQIIIFIDPMKRVIKDFKVNELSDEDFKEINKFIGNRAKILAQTSDKDDFSSGDNSV